MMYKIISRILVLITALFLVTSIEVSAQDVSFFDDEDLFNNTCPVLAVEDFEDTNAPLNSGLVCPSPFNSLTNNGCHSTGALIPGFSLSAASGFLTVVTPNTFGVTNVAVGPTTCADNSVITFTESVNAVGMELTSALGPTTVDVQVFGQGNVFLGTATVNLTPINSTFLGVVDGGRGTN